MTMDIHTFTVTLFLIVSIIINCWQVHDQFKMSEEIDGLRTFTSKDFFAYSKAIQSKLPEGARIYSYDYKDFWLTVYYKWNNGNYTYRAYPEFIKRENIDENSEVQP